MIPAWSPDALEQRKYGMMSYFSTFVFIRLSLLRSFARPILVSKHLACFARPILLHPILVPDNSTRRRTLAGMTMFRKLPLSNVTMKGPWRYILCCTYFTLLLLCLANVILERVATVSKNRWKYASVGCQTRCVPQLVQIKQNRVSFLTSYWISLRRI